ncbi:ester cyclase [Mucilaginibacter yixingensis]|nr:ester cyclase [Mucilaginibacter yixingensis]
MKKILFGLAIAGLFASCSGSNSYVPTAKTDSATVKMEKNKQTALAAVQAMNTKDINAAFKDCAPGYTEYGSTGTHVQKNMDSLKKDMQNFLDAFPELKAENLKAVADSNTVAVLGTWSGTFKKDFMGIKANNKPFKVNDADIYTFNAKGQITSHRSIQEPATFFDQLDIPMPKKKM